MTPSGRGADFARDDTANAGGSFLSRPIDPIRSSPLYVLGLLLVAVAMLLLPLLYLGLIALVGWSLWWWAVHPPAFERGLIVLRAILYAGPLFVGLILIVFMIKPIFAREQQAVSPFGLERGQAPLFHSFVDSIAAAVGAPSPAVIELYLLPNASASFLGGLGALFGRRLRLSVGLSLIAGMDIRDLAGVIAHELGHFAQGAGLRLTYIIRTINAWFGRIVYERDSLDWRLQEMSRESTFWIVQLTLLTARLAVWFTRRVLWVFMILGSAVSCFALRQMELDADRYQARVAGSERLAITFRRLQEIHLGDAWAQQQLNESWAERRLVDDYPRLVVGAAEAIPANTRALFIDALMAETKAGFLSDHPAAGTRVRRARAEATDGVVARDGPATALFPKFDLVCKWLTVGMYRAVFNREIREDELVPVRHLAARRDLAAQEQKASHVYCAGVLSPRRPLPEPDAESPATLDVATARRHLTTLRARLRAAAPKLEKAAKSFTKADVEAMESRVAKHLADALRRIAPRLLQGRIEKLERQAMEAPTTDAARAEAAGRLASADRAIAQRLGLALSLLDRPEVAAALESPDRLRQHVRRVLPVVRRWNETLPSARRLEDSVRTMGLMFGDFSEMGEDEIKARTVLDNLARGVREQLAVMRRDLAGLDYPFEHGGEQLALPDYLFAGVEFGNHPFTVAHAGSLVLERLEEMPQRLIGRLALVAMKVERAVGVEDSPPDPIA